MAYDHFKKKFDAKQFEALCALQCTQAEICGVFNTTVKTLDRWCKEEYGFEYKEARRKFSANGRVNLRRKQWKWADKSPAMAIFLGKNYLGQSDNPEKQETNNVIIVHDDISARLKELEDNGAK